MKQYVINHILGVVTGGDVVAGVDVVSGKGVVPRGDVVSGEDVVSGGGEVADVVAGGAVDGSAIKRCGHC